MRLGEIILDLEGYEDKPQISSHLLIICLIVQKLTDKNFNIKRNKIKILT